MYFFNKYKHLYLYPLPNPQHTYFILKDESINRVEACWYFPILSLSPPRLINGYYTLFREL